MFDPQHTGWRKASKSQGSGNCVEVAGLVETPGVLVRDSKDPDGPRLRFGPGGWAAFAAAAGRREFGHA
ncbi:DUF397 domain-containing protein [Micromonospora fluostatini]|uniref:DUF397 domain-containing protein n=1 Tax=Micromonospora fluostatini TaxID=1629071 RepID=A0ABY2DLS7_9ACTN|nr:DUF397 domain-containing protein [Micromonospora fluostatini]